MNYLQLVNKVLRRLRVEEVSSVTDNAYSLLIGEFVNQAKEWLEDAHLSRDGAWSMLRDTLDMTITGSALVNEKSITGSNSRTVIKNIYDQTNNYVLEQANHEPLTELLLLFPKTDSRAFYWMESGVDSTDKLRITIYPTPTVNATWKISAYVPQAELTNDNDILKVPYLPVILYAWAMATEERGEDGGSASSAIYQLAMERAADAINKDKNKFPEEPVWQVV